MSPFSSWRSSLIQPVHDHRVTTIVTSEALGLTRANAIESIRRFDVHDKKQLQVQREFRDDEQKLIQSAQQAARELEQLFESDMEPARGAERRAEGS